MNRFARSSALAGAAVIALVLAIAASATTTRSERSTAPTAGAAVTNYLTYVKGKRGKADPKKSKGYIGWVNQQGGQVVIGGLATAGAQLAVKYVNNQLGGVGAMPMRHLMRLMMNPWYGVIRFMVSSPPLALFSMAMPRIRTSSRWQRARVRIAKPPTAIGGRPSRSRPPVTTRIPCTPASRLRAGGFGPRPQSSTISA
jgi:hypothetical protein